MIQVRSQNLEYQTKLSQAALKRWLNPQYRERFSLSRKSLWSNPELRGKLVEGTKKGQAAAAAALRKKWLDPEYREKRLPHVRMMQECSRRSKPSSIELSLRSSLDALGIPYLAEHRIGPYLADIFLPRQRLVIEADGIYWHSLAAVRKRDVKRDEDMKRWGYAILRVSEKQIKKGQAEGIVLRTLGQSGSQS